MALDATVGSISANSYVTVLEATEYFANRAHVADSWTVLAVEDQESFLITNTLLLDWYVKFKGYKTSESQALKWPRSGVVRPSGASVASDIIPSEIKQAVYELTFFSLSVDRVAESDLAGLSQVQAGSLMIKTETPSFLSTAKEAIPDHVWKIVDELRSRGGIGVVRLMRA